MSKFVNQFSNRIHLLTNAEKYVFYYIDNNLKEASKQTLIQLADENSVSTTTIMRMCTKLGLSGYSNLKYIINNIVENSRPMDGEDSIHSVKHALNTSLDGLTIKQVKEVASLIKSHSSIVILSVGLTKPIGEYFAKLLIQAKRNCNYYYESHIIDVISNTVTNDTLVIFISNSGETNTLVGAMERLDYRKINTISLVSHPDSTLAKKATMSLSLDLNNHIINGYDATARSILAVIIDVIMNEYLSLDA